MKFSAYILYKVLKYKEVLTYVGFWISAYFLINAQTKTKSSSSSKAPRIS